MGGRLHTGLGQGLLDRGFEVCGRELHGEFKSLAFQDKVNIIANDLQKHFWDEKSCVIANSFGAYLFLNAQAQIEPYIGKVILLSPILGSFSNEDTLTTFVPPHAGRLLELARTKQFPIPKNCEIHVGEMDWQSRPQDAMEFGDLLGIKACVVPNAGHMLPKSYVGGLLDRLIGEFSAKSL
jgi:alpha-beta hydrolase superfamily lysophospholipase